MTGLRFFLRLAFLILASVLSGAVFQQMHPSGILPSSKDVRTTTNSPQLPSDSLPSQPQVHELLSAVWIEDGPVASAPAQPATLPADAPDVREVTWSQALAWLAKKQASLIDVRATTSYDTGHVPGAESFPVEELAKTAQGLMDRHPNPSEKLVFYCSNVRCPQAREAARLLIARHQRKEVYFIPGGYFQWRAENATPADP